MMTTLIWMSAGVLALAGALGVSWVFRRTVPSRAGRPWGRWIASVVVAAAVLSLGGWLAGVHRHGQRAEWVRSAILASTAAEGGQWLRSKGKEVAFAHRADLDGGFGVMVPGGIAWAPWPEESRGLVTGEPGLDVVPVLLFADSGPFDRLVAVARETVAAERGFVGWVLDEDLPSPKGTSGWLLAYRVDSRSKLPAGRLALFHRDGTAVAIFAPDSVPFALGDHLIGSARWR